MVVATRVSPRKTVNEAPVTFLTVSARSDLLPNFVVPSSICPSAVTLQAEQFKFVPRYGHAEGERILCLL